MPNCDDCHFMDCQTSNKLWVVLEVHYGGTSLGSEQGLLL